MRRSALQLISRLLIPLLLGISLAADAAQYRSRELKASSMGERVEKSVAELEAGLSDISDDYSRASTARYLARYLARHFSGSKDYAKAVSYYRQALQGEGLSTFAKQDILAELAQVHLLQNNYRQLLQALEQRRELGGKASSELLIMQAMAHHHIQQKEEAIAAADAAWAASKRPPATLLKQLLFIYYRSGSYNQAARVQQALLKLTPDDLDGWRQLSGIYSRMQNHTEAADALAMARHHGLQLSVRDITLLGELYNSSDNPYAAARLYQQSMKDNQLPVSVKHLDRLFYYWMQARERGKAIEALQQALTLEPDIERYLHLAQLQMEEQQWQPMKTSVINACNIALPDRFVSRANLLLGISELKLGNHSAARHAFINATLIGGEGEHASQYLRYMDANPAEEQETESFGGPCTPKWARTDSRQLAVAVKKAQTEPPQKLEYKVQTSKPQTLIYGNYTLGADELEKRLLPLVMKLGTHIVKNGGRINGNLHFIFLKPIEPDAEILQFQMAFPVSRKPQMLGRYKVLKDSGFKAATFDFNEAPHALPAYWLKLYETATEDGLTFTGVSRQVVKDAKRGRKEIKMELQLGVE